MSGNGSSAVQERAASGDPGRVESAFQREEVDAAVRAVEGGYVSDVDPRGLAIASETAAQLAEHFGARVLDWKLFRDEVTVVIEPADLVAVAEWMRDSAGFALLSEVSACDRLGSTQPHPRRFSVSYHLTRLVAGAPRLRLQVWVDEGQAVPSLVAVYPTADWHEREAWDMFGIEFEGRAGLRRILMDDEWVGHPARKDYPMGGEPVKFTNSLRET